MCAVSQITCSPIMLLLLLLFVVTDTTERWLVTSWLHLLWNGVVLVTIETVLIDIVTVLVTILVTIVTV